MAKKLDPLSKIDDAIEEAESEYRVVDPHAKNRNLPWYDWPNEPPPYPHRETGGVPKAK